MKLRRILTRLKAKIVVPTRVDMLSKVIASYRSTRLFADVIFVNSLVFLASTLEKIELIASSYLSSLTANSLEIAANKILGLHEKGEFKIKFINTSM